MQRNDRIAGVVFAGQKRLQPHALHARLNLLYLRRDLLGHAFVILFNAHIGKRQRILQRLPKRRILLQRVLDALELPQDLSRIFCILPEIRHERFLLQLLRLVTEPVYFQSGAEFLDIAL